MEADQGSRVLSTRDPDWDNFVIEAEGHDVFHTRPYMSLFERHFGSPALLYVYGNERDYIAYPFFLRDLARLPFFQDEDTLKGSSDIVSPWYYGGLLIHASGDRERAALLTEFHRSFENFCRERQVVSEFGRLHPFLGSPEQLSKFHTIRTSGSVVYLDLRRSTECLWQDMTRSNRKRIRRCLDAGVLVVADRSREVVDGFADLYQGLMNRKGAGEFYLFPREFFDDLLSRFPLESRLLVARYDDRIIAGLLLLGGGRFAHTYLSASDPGYLGLGPNNLLKWQGALLAGEMGHDYYLLGGGTDSLLAFKQSFSATAKDFSVYCRIYDPESYRRLTLLNSRYALSRGETGAPKTFFFPEYRRGVP